MAKLEELYSPHFWEMEEGEQVEFLEAYRKERAADLEKVSSFAKKKRVSNISDENRAMMKVLGLSAKDLKLLQELLPSVEEEQVEDDENEEEDEEE